MRTASSSWTAARSSRKAATANCCGMRPAITRACIACSRDEHMKLHIEALREFFKRYSEIFKFVWAERAKLDSPIREIHEAEFLPAALSLQESPVSPAPRIIMWLLIAFALIALLWSVFGRIDVV